MRTLARAGKQPVPLREACAERLVAGRGNVTALRTGSSSVKADRNRDRPDVLLACGARDPLARLSHDDDAPHPTIGSPYATADTAGPQESDVLLHRKRDRTPGHDA